MLRTAEQIKKEITELQSRILVMGKNEMFREDWTPGQHILHWLEHLEEQMNVQEGDKLTGLEILAGMPREEIQKMHCPMRYLAPKNRLVCTSACWDCLQVLSNTEFKRKSGTWVPVGKE